MREDDEIIEAYERELSGGSDRGVAPKPSRGKFWMIVVALAVAGAFLVGQILLNRPLVNAISTSQHSLRVALSDAQTLAGDAGSYSDADAESLNSSSSGGLHYLGPDDPSGANDQVSVLASNQEWSAAVEVRPGACFYIRRVPQRTLYGSGTVCTGRAALAASDSQW